MRWRAQLRERCVDVVDRWTLLVIERQAGFESRGQPGRDLLGKDLLGDD